MIDCGSERVSSVAVAVAGCSLLALSGSAFVTRASVSNTGAPADYPTPTFSAASISADGRYVAFDSCADNLAAGADDGGVFVRDTWAGHQCCRLGAGQRHGRRRQRHARDQRRRPLRGVRLRRHGPRPGGNGNFYQVFLRDRTTGVTTRISTKPNGNQGTDDSGRPSLSNDGRYIAFESDSPGLVAGDTNDWTDVFVRDRVTNTTKRVSLTATGAEADIGGESPSISADGRFVAFASTDMLTPNDTNLAEDVYVRDMVANTTTLVSIAGERRRRERAERFATHQCQRSLRRVRVGGHQSRRHSPTRTAAPTCSCATWSPGPPSG